MTTAELKKLVGNSKLVIGTQRTMKELKKGNLKKIFISSNCHQDVKDSIISNAKLLGVEVSQLDVTNEETGIIVKKPFAVSVVSLQK